MDDSISSPPIDDHKISQTEPEEHCSDEPEEPINRPNAQLPDEKLVPDEQISERAKQAIDILKEELQAVKEQPRRIQALWKAIGILGRPSGSSPPQHIVVKSFPPSQKKWKDYKNLYGSPIEFAVDEYGKYFKKGWTKAQLTHDGQDKPLYDAIVYWLKHHKNELDERLRPYFLPPKELNDKCLENLGIATAADVTPELVPDLRERMRINKLAHRRYG